MMTQIADPDFPQPDVRLTPAGDAIAARVGDETLVLDQNSGLYFGLRGGAGRIWELLAQAPSTFETLAEQLVEEFDGDPSAIREDLRLTLRSLAERGLIRAA